MSSKRAAHWRWVVGAMTVVAMASVRPGLAQEKKKNDKFHGHRLTQPVSGIKVKGRPQEPRPQDPVLHVKKTPPSTPEQSTKPPLTDPILISDKPSTCDDIHAEHRKHLMRMVKIRRLEQIGNSTKNADLIQIVKRIRHKELNRHISFIGQCERQFHQQVTPLKGEQK